MKNRHLGQDSGIWTEVSNAFSDVVDYDTWLDQNGMRPL